MGRVGLGGRLEVWVVCLELFRTGVRVILGACSGFDVFVLRFRLFLVLRRWRWRWIVICAWSCCRLLLSARRFSRESSIALLWWILCFIRCIVCFAVVRLLRRSAILSRIVLWRFVGGVGFRGGMVWRG